MTQHEDSLIDKARRALGMDVDRGNEEIDMHRSRTGAVADEAARRDRDRDRPAVDERTGSAGEDAEDAWEHERRAAGTERRR